MAYKPIRSGLPPAEFEAALPGIDLSGGSLLFVNGTQVTPATLAAAVAGYRPKN